MNQNPEQIARDHIDQLLVECGWIVQSKNKLNLAAGLGVAVTEYRTDTGPVDYLLFINKIPVGVIDAKKAEEGVRLTSVEDQSLRYAEGKLKYLDNDPLHFAYESTGEVTRFTDYRDPKPRSRPVFTFIGLKLFRDGCERIRPCALVCMIYPNCQPMDCAIAR